MIPVVIAVMIAVIVAPSPIFFLFLGRELPEVPMTVTVGFVGPTVVVNDLIAIPGVIVGVIRIIDPIGMVLGTANSCQR
jgi:hypothetical protein